MLERYLNAYKNCTQSITIEDLSGVLEITTPFLDRHNDHIAIYGWELQGNRWCFSDNGDAYETLTAETGRSPEEAMTILLEISSHLNLVLLPDGTLQTVSNGDQLQQRMATLIQALVAVAYAPHATERV